MVSAIGRLLDELSWEGNARKYRGGGHGLENVLTAEVFQALDLLPRDAFLGRVLRAASHLVSRGDPVAAVLNAADHAEDARVEVLLGDLSVPELGVKAQPDVIIESPASYLFVEAKRVRGGSFQAKQLARELLLTSTHGEGRQPVLLLVLGEPPPIALKGHGRVDIDEAITLSMNSIEERVGHRVQDVAARSAVAYLTWSDISVQVRTAMETYENSDRSTFQAVRRIAFTLIESVATHS